MAWKGEKKEKGGKINGKPEGKEKNSVVPVRIVGRKGAWGAKPRGSPCFGEEMGRAVLVEETQFAGRKMGD